MSCGTTCVVRLARRPIAQSHPQEHPLPTHNVLLAANVLPQFGWVIGCCGGQAEGQAKQAREQEGTGARGGRHPSTDAWADEGAGAQVGDERARGSQTRRPAGSPRAGSWQLGRAAGEPWSGARTLRRAVRGSVGPRRGTIELSDFYPELCRLPRWQELCNVGRNDRL